MSFVVFGSDALEIDDLVDIAYKRRRTRLNPDPLYRQQIEEARKRFEILVEKNTPIYGVTTGFGENIEMVIGSSQARTLARNLIRFHGCGTGRIFSVEESRAIVAARLQSLCFGRSAVRWELLEKLQWLLENDVLPAIPAEGSVGASGDLTPLSYVAAVLTGEREVLWQGKTRPTSEVFAEFGIEGLSIGPKESLAIMNGTSVMTALAALAMNRATQFSEISSYLSAALCDVCEGNAGHFDKRIHESKPHPGQMRVAKRMADWLEYNPQTHKNPKKLQSVYSIRCAPHVIGVLEDSIDALTPWVETELNGCSDNPLFDPENGDVLHGGNFYGGHIGMAMDMLKIGVANVADLLDRQMQLLCGPTMADGELLPRNLVKPGLERSAGDARHGFKAMSISTSALAAEALKLTMPATSFSRSTESHNQDKVSMGTIASRDALRILTLSEQILAILTIALSQAVDLRSGSETVAASKKFRDIIREEIALAEEDRRFDIDIVSLLKRLDSNLVYQLRGLLEGI